MKPIGIVLVLILTFPFLVGFTVTPHPVNPDAVVVTLDAEERAALDRSGVGSLDVQLSRVLSEWFSPRVAQQREETIRKTLKTVSAATLTTEIEAAGLSSETKALLKQLVEHLYKSGVMAK